MARNQQKLNHYFWSFFGFCPFYDQIKHKKVSKSSNAEKNGLGEYQTINSRHFLLSCNPFWQSSDFLVTIGPSRSVCSGSEKQRRPAKGSGNRKPTLLNFITKRKGILRDPQCINSVEKCRNNMNSKENPSQGDRSSTANIFESGIRPTPRKCSGKAPRIPHCKLD